VRSIKLFAIAGLLGLTALTAVGVLHLRERRQAEEVARQAIPGGKFAVDWQGPAEVVDGDTLRLPQGKVRLLGIDAFEKRQTCNGVPCGREATAMMQALVLGKTVHCTGNGDDRYGRLLAYCDTGRTHDLGGAMVLSGWALSYVNYSHYYDPFQNEARIAHAGAWAKGFVLTPWEWRRQQNDDATDAARIAIDAATRMQLNQ